MLWKIHLGEELVEVSDGGDSGLARVADFVKFWHDRKKEGSEVAITQ
jgi:translation initiation factor IF-3